MYERLRELEGQRHTLLTQAREKWTEYEAIEDRSGTDATEKRAEYDAIITPNTPNTCLLYTSPSPRDS